MIWKSSGGSNIVSPTTLLSSLLFNTTKTTPITKRHIEQRILYHIPKHHLFRIIQDVNQYSR